MGLVRDFFYLDKDLTDRGEVSFCLKALNQRDKSMGDLTMGLGATFHAITLVTDYFLTVRADFSEFLLKFHLFNLLWTLLYWIVGLRRVFFWRFIVFLAQFSTILGYAYILRWVSDVDPILGLPHVKVWTGMVVLGIFAVALCPFHNRWALIYSAVLLPLSVWSWARVPNGSDMVYVSMLAILGTQYFQRVSVIKVRQYARGEYANVQKLLRAEKEIYDQQLIVAREIHESFGAPPAFFRPGLGVKFLQKRSQTVGGDWLAIRSENEDQMYVVVADASGKGVQAALVIHAIQAIWADSLSRAEFDPCEWLERLNSVLLRMGVKQMHTATVGILEISRQHVEYWSAGHIPAFVILENESQDIRPLAARGSMLGVNTGLDFASARLEIQDRSIEVILGSDGVFPKGSSTSARDVFTLLERIKVDPNYLQKEDFGIDDDRSLVTIDIDASKWELS